MKHVAKGSPPATFTAWLARTANDDGRAWNHLQNPEKDALFHALLAEQGWICCYCGRPVARGDSHIEHFRPRRDYPDRIFDYGNLHASCQREGHSREPRVCGHAKGKWFDDVRHVDPQDPACERRFRFLWDGTIEPADDGDTAAKTMIAVLNLNAPFLVKNRQAAMDGVLREDPADPYSPILPTSSLLREAAANARPDAEGRLPGFAHAVARRAEDETGRPLR